MPPVPGTSATSPRSVAEGRQQLLRHPAGAQQPVALGAVGDEDARPGLRHQAALSFAMVSSSTSKLA